MTRHPCILTLALIAGCTAEVQLQQADRIVVDKSERVLQLWSGGALLKEYGIVLGGNPIGHKQREGDERTPEGHYIIDYRKADSAFHRALHISYPSEEDRRAAAAQGHSPGGMIMIHGIRNGLGWIGPLHRLFDWTDSCIAVTNAEIEEIWASVAAGTPIEIRP